MSRRKRPRSGPRFRDVGLRLPSEQPATTDDAIPDLPPLNAAPDGGAASAGDPAAADGSGEPPPAPTPSGEAETLPDDAAASPSTTTVEPSHDASSTSDESGEPDDVEVSSATASTPEAMADVAEADAPATPNAESGAPLHDGTQADESTHDRGVETAAGGDAAGVALPEAEHDEGGAAAGSASTEADDVRIIDVPDHAPHFWHGMADELADEPQLRLRPRAAVRPVTQPPPISEDSVTYDDGGWRPRRGRQRRAVWVAAAILAVLAAVGAFQAADDGRSEARVDDAATTSTSPEPAEPADPADQGASGDGKADEAPPPPVDPAAPLSPDGVGPLAIGATLRDLEAAGMTIAVDEPTFRGTGGSCFDATVADVGDLALRFRGPVPGQVVSEPGDGVLGALTIDRQRGSFRTTPEGVGVNSTADEVRNAYADQLREAPHPFLPSGQVLTYVPEDGAPNGLAFTTDRGVVTSVTAGAVDLLASPDGCPS